MAHPPAFPAPALQDPNVVPALLRADIAGPSLMASRSILTGHPASGLTPQRLGALLRAAEDGDADAYLELAEEMEERDPHYRSVLNTRKYAVAQLPITVKAASDEKQDIAMADLVREWVDRDTLEAELFDILDAIGKGYSETEIVWDTAAVPWVPVRLETRDPRWFVFDRTDGRTPLLRNAGQPTPLPRFKFISHVHPTKTGITIRTGLARVAAWSYLFKNYALKDWVAFAEIFGLPFRVGKYDAGASEEDIRKLMRAVADIGSDAAAVFPKSMEVDFIDGKSSSGSIDLYEKLCNFCDMQVSKVVLGQTATTDAVIGGLGSGAEHGAVRGDIERADAKALAATLNRDIVKALVDLNYGPQKRYPKIVIGREEQVDLKTMTDALEALVPLGLDVEISQVRDRLGFADPEAGAATLNAPATSPADAPGTQSGGLVPEKPAPAFLDLLKTAQRANPTATAAANGALPGASAQDDIDVLVQIMADEGWQAIMAPLVDPAIAAVTSATDYAGALAALGTAFGEMDATKLAERLERAAFAVRAVAETGADDA